MGYPVPMKILNGLTYLQQDVGHLHLPHPTLLVHEGKKSTLWHVLHDEVNMLWIVKHGVELHYTWVVTEHMKFDLLSHLVLHFVFLDQLF